MFGGEVSYKTNFTSLTRNDAAFDPITTLANTTSLCTTASADPMARMPTQCLLRGMPGTYTRATAEARLAAVVHRFRGRDLDAVREHPRRRDRRRYLEPARRFELPARRQHPGAAGDADDRPRISLSLHQRSAVGHHDDRADRAGHRSPQRILCRQASQRGRAEHGVRRQQPVQRRQILRLRSRRRRRPRQCRRAGDDAVRPRRLGQRAVRTVLPAVRPELLRGAGRDQYRGRFRPAEREIRLCRARQLFAQPHLHLQRAHAHGRGDAQRQSLRG